MKQGNSDCDAFPSRKLQVTIGNIVTWHLEINLSMAFN